MDQSYLNHGCLITFFFNIYLPQRIQLVILHSYSKKFRFICSLYTANSFLALQAAMIMASTSKKRHLDAPENLYLQQFVTRRNKL